MAQKSEDLDILNKKLAQTRRDIVNVQQKTRRQNHDRVGPAKNPSTAILETAVLIVFLENGDFVAATAFLSVSASKAAWSLSPKPKKHRRQSASGHAEASRSACPPQWLECLRDRWTRWSQSDSNTTTDGSQPTAFRLCRARSFLADSDLVQWVQERNKKGLAPTGVAIVSAASLKDPKRQFPFLCDPALPHPKKKKRLWKWVKRWALRNRLSRGHFKVGPALDLDEARQKAYLNVKESLLEVLSPKSVFFCNAAPFFVDRGPIWVAPISCPENGREIRTTRPAQTQTRAHFPGTKSEPLFTIFSFFPGTHSHSCRLSPAGSGPISWSRI